jgi:hypothetical protein
MEMEIQDESIIIFQGVSLMLDSQVTLEAESFKSDNGKWYGRITFISNECTKVYTSNELDSQEEIDEILMGTIEDTIKGMQRIDPGMTLVQRFNGVIVGKA